MTLGRSARLALVVATAFCLQSIAKTAAAEGPPRVMFVAAKGSPFASRVRAEIEAMGFTVADSPSLDASVASDVVAVARVFEVPPPKRVELWLSVGPTHELSRKTVVQPAPGDDDSTQTVRASEQLRAFFQPLRPATAKAPELSIIAIPVPRPAWADLPVSSPAPVVATRAPTPASPQAPLPLASKDATSKKEARSHFTVDGGLGIASLPGGTGVDVELGARWLPLAWLAPGVRLSVPVAPSTLRDPVGQATINVFRAEISPEAVVCGSCRVRFSGGPTLGVAWVRVVGTSATLNGRSGDTTVPIIGATAELAPRIVDHLRLALRGELGFASTAVNIAFQVRDAGTFGRPFAVGSVGPSLDF